MARFLTSYGMLGLRIIVFPFCVGFVRWAVESLRGVVRGDLDGAPEWGGRISPRKLLIGPSLERANPL